VEFDKKVEDRTGERRIVLHKDYLKLGERAAQQGDTTPPSSYASTDKTHPDYSEAHARLGQIYLDDKNDYEAAVREFESVLMLPQNKDLIYKQFAVAFTNLGTRITRRATALVDRDREGAAQALAKAVQNLQIAKQNTRFFRRAPRRGAARHVLLPGPRVPQALPGHRQGLARGHRRPRLARVLSISSPSGWKAIRPSSRAARSAQVLGPDQRPAS